MRKYKLIAIFILVSTLISCVFAPCYAEEMIVEPLTVDMAKEIYHRFFNAQFDLYDTNGYQVPAEYVYFNCDSHGTPYANGQIYCYLKIKSVTSWYPVFEYVWADLSGAYESAREGFETCLTPELAERMLEDFHVSGGPDVEFLRQTDDGTWCRLYSIISMSILPKQIKEIRNDGTKAYVYVPIQVYYYDESAPVGINYKDIDGVVEFEYTENGWLISGGTVFDYMRGFAETAVYTGDDSAVRAVFLATAAVVCAVIPATVAVTVKRRRRED